MVNWKHDIDSVNAQKHILCFVHYDDVRMGTIASQITSLSIVYSIVYSDADQRKHQSSAALAFVRGIHRGPVHSPHKWPATRKMLPFDDVIMINYKTDIHNACFPLNKIKNKYFTSKAWLTEALKESIRTKNKL